MRYKVLECTRGMSASAMLYEFAHQEHVDRICHSMQSVMDYISKKTDTAFVIQNLSFKDEDDLNSVAITNKKGDRIEYHYLIIREDRLEFNLDVFAEAFFNDIKIKDTDKKLGIKGDLDDIILRLLLSADVR